MLVQLRGNGHSPPVASSPRCCECCAAATDDRRLSQCLRRAPAQAQQPGEHDSWMDEYGLHRTAYECMAVQRVGASNMGDCVQRWRRVKLLTPA